MRRHFKGQILLKRILDITACLAAAPLVLPLLLICAVATRMDSPGPILFTQTRTGKDGRPFQMYKFRSMVVDAEERKAELAHLNILSPPDFKILDDPRITRVGRFLRATSLDELPQLLNVLRGEMSLVGPRPTSFAPATWQLWQTRRLDVPPGITGLWQVEGRHTTTFDERLRLDIAYIDGYSVWLDIRILLRTVSTVLQRSGA